MAPPKSSSYRAPFSRNTMFSGAVKSKPAAKFHKDFDLPVRNQAICLFLAAHDRGSSLEGAFDCACSVYLASKTWFPDEAIG